MTVRALQQEMEYRYHDELVAAGMPSFDVAGESNGEDYKIRASVSHWTSVVPLIISSMLTLYM